ncbi:hypothetical protein F4775DRAFT_587121 [Biscogniauxia sp. FL1348]|nr:hypothetical protein F4775DRAFT_587121 [Biscogniauxia sp. FL1348]
MGPPYAQSTALLGGIPTRDVDVPISSVFIVIFAVGAAGHIVRFRVGLSRGHKFFPSAANFGFCMTRIIFVAAGVVILFILNIIYAQRILRSIHPAVGWSRPFSRALLIVYVLIILTLVIVITTTVQSFYTLDTYTRLVDVDLIRYGVSVFATVASLPFAIITYVVLAPRRIDFVEDHFRKGTWRRKSLIVMTAAVFLSLGTWFRAGVDYQGSRPITNPAWYHSKACFYVFNFTVKSIVIYIYLLSRADLLFYVPDGSLLHVRIYTKYKSQTVRL